MPLSAGDKLGPYEILAPIGKGGMGEVYRAHDSRLNRDVAIKVASAQFTERFTGETRAIAALNHTNICHLYDVGPDYLVMELVEGQDLRGPLDFEEALPIIRQLIDGIEAAHEKNIIHRDLKPANIKITPEGVVKILDFGLAKAMEPARSNDGNAENSPTFTIGATAAGAILGTAAYMSPEQAKGKTADRRSDIWSFGVIVYEILTGKRLFQGESAVEIMGAVLSQEPDISAAPARVQKLLRWCLEKDRKHRLQAIGDARRLLEDAPALTTAPPRLQGWLAWGVAGLLLLALAALGFVHFRQKAGPEPTLRSSITLPANSTVHSFAISPDGRYLVLAAAVNGKRQLWLRPMDALQAQPMPFTEEAAYPFWSPDSRSIGFFAQGKLKKIAASGGPAQALCDVLDGRGGSWSRDGVILFSPRLTGAQIQRVPAAGGVPADLTKTTAGYTLHPVFLPDGRHFLYRLTGAAAEQSGVYVSSLDGQENRRVLADNSGVVFAAPARSNRAGHILFVRENTLMAAPFDAVTAQVAGDVFPVAEDVSLITNNTYLPATVSETGLLLYETGGATGGASQIGWYDRAGKSLGPVGAPGAVFDPAISPDEKSVAFRRTTEAGSDLWVRDLNRGAETQLTNDPSTNAAPVWSPNSDRVIFLSTRNGGDVRIYQKAASGSGQEEPLPPGNVRGAPLQWSRDGRFIVYLGSRSNAKNDIWVLPTDGAAADRKPMRFLTNESGQLFGQLSPDNRWMALTSDRSGRPEVYVQPFPAGEGEWTISISGGAQPRWRGDGKELFFVATDGKMMAVAVKAAPGVKLSFEPGAPVALFDSHMAKSATGALFEYDVTADGKRFLINTTTGRNAAPTPPLTVVTNWAAGLR